MKVLEVQKMNFTFPKKKELHKKHILQNLEEHSGVRLEVPELTDDLKEGFYSTNNDDYLVVIRK